MPSSEATFPAAINGKGFIVGSYKSNGQFHGFLRDAAGGIITFDPTGSTFTSPIAISSDGKIVGYFRDSSGSHGFKRATNGLITTFDVVGSVGTFPGSVNTLGQIAGSYYPASQSRSNAGELPICFVFQAVSSFVRESNGTFTVFSPFDSVVSGAVGVNRTGVVGGVYLDGNCTSHGFLREP